MILSRYYRKSSNKTNVDPNALRIYWGTDAHVVAEVDGKPNAEGAKAGNRYYYTASQKLQNFINDINAAKPDLVYFGGDSVDEWESESVNLFLSKWNQIDPMIRKELTIGNHDLAWTPTLANSEIAQSLGYGNKPIIAGSKFNQSFTLSNGYNSVKIISVDTNMNETGTHQVITAQTVKETVRNWVKSELLNSGVNDVLIFSHGGMEDDMYHFNETDGLAFKEMITNVLAQRPLLKIYSIFGHNHNPVMTEYKRYDNPITSYSVPPIVDFETGKYAEISFSSKDGLKLVLKELKYPYA